MHHIFAIAKNSFKETVRDRMLYGMVFFGAIFLAILSSLSTASLGEDLHVLVSVGLGGVYLFGMIITLFLGASLLGKEIERKTLYFVLSRPVSRGAVIAGKFLGLLASVSCAISILAFFFFAALSLKGGIAAWNPRLLLALAFQVFESALIIALVIFFSSFLRPALAVFASLAALFAGHSLSTIVSAAEKTSPALGKIALFFSYLFPNLEKFNIRNDILYHFSLSPAEIFFTLAYAIFGTLFALLLATLVFEKREL